MAQVISNTVSTPQKGLVSTNPFLNIKSIPTISKKTTVPAVANTATNQVATNNAQSGGINKDALQSLLDSDKSQLATLQAQQASQNNSGTNTNNNAIVTPTGQTFPGLVNTLATTAGASSPEYQRAQEQYNTANQQLADLKRAAANNQFIGAGTNMAEYAGTQGLLANRLANEENALTGEMTAAQQAAQTATGQQSTQQSGLASAGNLAQPTTQYGALTSPLTGQVISSNGVVSGGSNLSTEAQSALSALPETGQNAVMLEAQKVANNQETQAQALNNLSSYGQTGVTALNAILGSGFNANTNTGASAAQQSNVQTAGTAGVSANQNVFNNAYSAYADLQNAVQNVDQFGSLLTSGMVTSDGTTINPSDIKYANQTLAAVRNQLSTPAQATYDTTLAALTSKITGLLSVGGNEIPSQLTADAKKILDGSLPLGSLNAVLSRIQNEGNILLQNQAKKVNDAWKGIQSGGTGTSSGSSSSGTTKTVGGYTYTKDSNGKWVVKK